MKPLMGLTILVLLGVVGWLLNWKGCNAGTTTGIQADTIKTKKDSIGYKLIHDTVDRPYYVPKYKYIERLIPANVDTAAILADYHNIRLYNDTLTNDSNLTYISKDTVTHNRITSRKPKYILHTKEKTVYSTTETTITKYDTRYHYWIGGLLAINKFGIGPLLNVTHNHINGGLYYDLINKNAGVTLTYKIR